MLINYLDGSQREPIEAIREVCPDRPPVPCSLYPGIMACRAAWHEESLNLVEVDR